MRLYHSPRQLVARVLSRTRGPGMSRSPLYGTPTEYVSDEQARLEHAMLGASGITPANEEVYGDAILWAFQMGARTPALAKCVGQLRLLMEQHGMLQEISTDGIETSRHTYTDGRSFLRLRVGPRVRGKAPNR